MSDKPPRQRRKTARKTAAEPASANVPAVTDQPPPLAGPAADAAFEAQLLGQGGQKRGLRGGKPVLDEARTAYLKTEWSGSADRRPPKGIITKTKI